MPCACSLDELRAARQLGASKAWLVATSESRVMDAVMGAPGEVRIVTALSGSPLSCLDVRGMAREAHVGGMAVVANAGVTGLFGCAYGQLGADLTTVKLKEGLTLVAAADVWLSERMSSLAHLVSTCGPSIEDAEALHAQLESGARGWRRQSDVAQVAASYLRCHPSVGEVRYPGLKGDPSFSVAARTLQSGFGPLVDYRRKDADGWCRVACDTDDAKALVMELELRLMALAVGDGSHAS
ncbi:MAG: PLP-dependent transferase [Atopobiaceae bacterium]|nr:PLP-dependent transferase [Atopobiaceae bacterium]